MGVITLSFVLSFPFAFMYQVSWILVAILLSLTVADIFLHFNPSSSFSANRSLAKLLSIGDENPVELQLKNHYHIPISVEVYDELPVQFQERNFGMSFQMNPQELKKIEYEVIPKERGVYTFGNINVIARSVLGIVARRYIIENEIDVPVYPSIIQMKKYELIAFARISTYDGIKKVRRLGHSYEFEQIKTYVQGDDFRSINWKATGRRSQLMVNQYEDERAQQVYCVIDKSHSMKMPFNGLSLMDYAINSSLVISNIVLKKNDRAGLITYSNKIGTAMKAERSSSQIKKILHALYKEREFMIQADYELLYRSVRNVIKSRSLIFLYLNFESEYALERALPILKKINHLHLLVVMIFENTELIDYTRKEVNVIKDIYTQTVSQDLIHNKRNMVIKLRKYGIQTILSKPEDLSINTVNKYLELKQRGLA